MKKLSITALTLLLSVSLFAEIEYGPYSIGASNGRLSADGITAVVTAGEPITGTVSDERFSLKAGFVEVITESGLILSVEDDPVDNVQPYSFNLSDPYPNPFNSTTTISFNLQRTGIASLNLYDVMGRRVAKLQSDAPLQAGSHQYTLQADDLASGVYYVMLEQADSWAVKKIVLMK